MRTELPVEAQSCIVNPWTLPGMPPYVGDGWPFVYPTWVPLPYIPTTIPPVLSIIETSPVPVPTGWQCPVCRRVWAPTVKACEECKP